MNTEQISKISKKWKVIKSKEFISLKNKQTVAFDSNHELKKQESVIEAFKKSNLVVKS